MTLSVTSPGPGAVAISVSDTGPGVPEHETEAVFEEFYRGPNGRSVASGAGLGLAIARGLALALGGDLTLRSAEGEGCVFTLTVPADR